VGAEDPLRLLGVADESAFRAADRGAVEEQAEVGGEAEAPWVGVAWPSKRSTSGAVSTSAQAARTAGASRKESRPGT
jgi:hypothetical protein